MSLPQQDHENDPYEFVSLEKREIKGRKQQRRPWRRRRRPRSGKQEQVPIEFNLVVESGRFIRRLIEKVERSCHGQSSPFENINNIHVDGALARSLAHSLACLLFVFRTTGNDDATDPRPQSRKEEKHKSDRCMHVHNAH